MLTHRNSYNQLYDMLFFINKHIDNVNPDDIDFIKNITARVDKKQKITPKQFRKVRFIYVHLEY